jgi:acyl-CoA dehydrogenase
MNFDYSDKVEGLIARINAFMVQNIYPREAEFSESCRTAGVRWDSPPWLKDLQSRARSEGLWNLFMPGTEYGAGLSNLEYAPLAEAMGRVLWAPMVFNCNAPDTGNMEVLEKYGSAEQKEQWLLPLLSADIRSGFAMTEPAVASSDATNIETSILSDGEDYVINGRKWFTTGAMYEDCEILILMGKTDAENPNRHRQQSMILVPMDTAGVDVVRPLKCFGYEDPPLGHGEMVFDNVRVPKENLLLGEGRGFEIAQGRLGPGRIHHCMRLIGLAQRALEEASVRVELRSTFGKKLSEHQSVREDIARIFCEIEQARLLTLMAADKMDRNGNKLARDLIAAIKIVAPQMACSVLDRAIQLHGGAGLTEDFFLAEAYNYARSIRLADGPDQVHMMSLGKQLVRRYASH